MRPRCFIEAPAGLAAVSLRLHGGPNCRPPISRMGNKAGYSGTILGLLGLRSGSGAGSYLWCEADPDVAALLRTYPDPAMLRRVAEIIRGWKDEEPRALWERLRAERKARGPTAAPDVAGWVISSMWSYEQGNVATGFVGPGERRQDTSAAAAACKNLADHAAGAAGFVYLAQTHHEAGTLNGGFVHPEDGGRYGAGREATADRCHRLASFAVVASSNRLINIADDGTGDLRNTGEGGTTFGGAEFATPAGEVADRLEDVAASSLLGQWSYRRGEPESGFNHGLLEDREPTPTGGNAAKARTVEQEAGLFAPAARASSWPPVLVLPAIPEAADVAAWLGTPGDLDGVVVYCDPPYRGTTGYRFDLPRADVVRHALDFAALGATVAVSEAVAVDELVALGWHVIDIATERRGQKRTFSKAQGEFVTMNRAPVQRPASQPSLFAAGA